MDHPYVKLLREFIRRATALKVNGLPLPRSLVAALNSGRWRAPDDVNAWYALFPRAEVNRPMLYELGSMLRENRAWKWETGIEYTGIADGMHDPGDIDPRQSLLVGDLGPDQPIALDYRSSHTDPSVVYLTTTITTRSYWVKVASGIDEFLWKLGRRCPFCCYNLRATPDRCPECGTTSPHAGAFAKKGLSS